MLDSKIEQFIRDKAGDIKHSGRTFFEHLMGVYHLLERQSSPDYVCLAGLFHSIYGTNIFRHQAVPITERDQVSEVIGRQSERLAYIFCSCDRPKALVEAVKRGSPYQVVNRRDGSIIPLSLKDIRDLLEIEAANLMDQGGGKMFLRVIAAWRSIGETSDA